MEEYGFELAGWRNAAITSGVLSAVLLVLALPEGSLIPFLQGLIPAVITRAASLILFLVCALMGRNVLKEGFVALANKTPNADTLALLSAGFTLLDGVTLFLGLRADSLPLCAPCALVITFRLITHYCEKKGKRDACQVAASAPQHYLVTQDPNTINGKPAFRKWLSAPRGFGSQIQTRSEQDFRFQRLVPVLMVACVVLGLLTTVAHHQPRLIFWSLSALFTASATLSAGLGNDLPFLLLGSRLRKLGAAVAGWPGTKAGKGCQFALLSDFDLYPPGTVTVNAVNSFGTVPKERIISLTASVIRASGSGLLYPMERLVKQTGAGYVQVTNLTMEKGGIRAQSQQGQSVMIGSAEYLAKLGVTIPADAKGKDTILCALDRVALGSISLRYTVINSIEPSLDTMLDGRLSPVLATRDFFFSPQRLGFGEDYPLDQLIFPPLAHRIRLSTPVRTHGPDIVAILSREGVAPYAQAVVGASRLHRAARLSGVLSRVSACIGVLLTATLSSAGALGAMCSLSLSLYLLLWAVPVLLLSLWVVHY